MPVNYGNIQKNSNPSADGGGYKNEFIFFRRDDALSIKKPTAAGLVIGDTVEIATAHTFTSPAGARKWACKVHSVTGKGETTGEDGAQEIEYQYAATVLGDSASTQEQMQRMVNDDIVCFFKDADCLSTDKYVQLGDECVSPTIKVSPDFKTTKEGKKEWPLAITCKRRFFYNAAITFAS